MIKINIFSLRAKELFYQFIELMLPKYWVLISLIVRVWGYIFWSLVDLLAEINAIMQQTPSTTSNSILSQDYNRSKDPLVEGCIKQRCGIGYSKLSNFIHSDCNFANFELYLVKVVIHLLIFVSNINIV